MGHNIYFNEKNERHSFFSVKEKAWHGLGQVVDSYPSSAEALKFAGLDYTIEKREICTTQGIEIPGYFATIRTDTAQPLGIVGKDYEIIQNIDAFSFFDAIVGGDGIQYETAGALGKGERIFITAKLPGYIKVGREDLVEKYLFLTTSHDGYGSIMAAFTPVRIVCNNTLNAALKNCSHAIKIRHTANAKERLEQAHRLMGISNQIAGQLEEIFNGWSRIRIADKEIRKLIEIAMAPAKEVYQGLEKDSIEIYSTRFTNACDAVFTYAMNNPTQQLETTKGTLFGTFNSITGYYQNVRTYKNEEAKLKSLLFNGIAQSRTQKAFNLCARYAKSFDVNILAN